MNNFTPRAQQVLSLGRIEAVRLKHNYMGSEHLLLGLLKPDQGIPVHIFGSMGIDFERVRVEVERQVGIGKTEGAGNKPYTPELKKILALAGKEARALKHNYVGIDHILLGLIRKGDGAAARILEDLGVDLAQVRDQVHRAMDPNPLEKKGDPESESPSTEAASATPVLATEELAMRATLAAAAGEVPNLSAHGQNLMPTKAAGGFDLIEGFDEEVDDLIRILCRLRRNNAILVGDSPAAGRAIVLNLASLIGRGDVPDPLFYQQVYAVDLNHLATHHPDEKNFFAKFARLTDEAHRNGKILLFLENLDSVWDFTKPCDQWKPYLSSPVREALIWKKSGCLGILPQDAWKALVENDSTTAGAFVPVFMKTVTEKAALSIMRNWIPRLEAFHGVVYPDEVVRTAVSLGTAHFGGDPLPEAVFRLSDDAGVRARIRAERSRPEKIQEIETEIGETYRKKLVAVREQRFEDARSLKAREKEKCRQRDEWIEQWRAEEATQFQVRLEDIQVAVSELARESPESNP